MFKKICIAAAGVLTLAALVISYVANNDLAERRDDLYARASSIADSCSGLRDEWFRYEEAKRNAFAAYQAKLSHTGSGRNRNFRRLLAGSSSESFARAVEEFAHALEVCEDDLRKYSPESEMQRRTPVEQVSTAAREVASSFLEGSTAAAPSGEESRTLEDLEEIDGELIERSAKALPGAAAAREQALREAQVLGARIARLGSLALLLQLLATGVVLVRELAD